MSTGPAAFDALTQNAWQRIDAAGHVLWFRGHLHGQSLDSVARRLAAVTDAEALAAQLRTLDGHFALVALSERRAFAAVDRIRSMPLAYGWDGRRHVLSGAPEMLRRTLGLTAVDPDAALSLAMAGYTVGGASLYRDLNLLAAGELAWFEGQSVQRHRYSRYQAWTPRPRPWAELKAELTDVTLTVLRKMVASVGNRPIWLPLSAGMDSRLIASGLRHLGCENVVCFSYGLPGNFESEASRRIATTLGYPWHFIPISVASQRRWFASDDNARYHREADTCASTPFEQDLAVIRSMQASGLLPADAVVVNGNTGDYISGGHVLKPLHHMRPELTPAARKQLILDTLVKKHFRLWHGLAAPDNDARIRTLLEHEIALCGADLADPAAAHGVYEYCEFQDRQAKYVVNGQRAYEFAGVEWRLPLWDVDYIDFWQGAPLEAKVDQALYREMLHDADWGGVWQGWQVDRHVSPNWMRWLVRPACKALHLPLGRARWHAFERRFLYYWMDILAGQALIPYGQVASDRRGARHFLAWQTEAYLARHGLDWQGSPAADR